MLVTFRLALETFASYASYDLVYYDDDARKRVHSIKMGEATLQVHLKAEHNVAAHHSLKKVTHFEASRINHHFLIILVSVVYSLSPFDKHISFPGKRFDAWSYDVDLLPLVGPSGDNLLVIQFNKRALADADHYDSNCFAPVLF